MYGRGGAVAVGGGTAVATTGGNIGLLVVIGLALLVSGIALLRLAVLHR
ncbi:hypothetical protein [Jatrophihabitans sp.]|nr:hypothetical protein [Jatrophihabitans sp.]